MPALYESHFRALSREAHAKASSACRALAVLDAQRHSARRYAMSSAGGSRLYPGVCVSRRGAPREVQGICWREAGWCLPLCQVRVRGMVPCAVLVCAVQRRSKQPERARYAHNGREAAAACHGGKGMQRKPRRVQSYSGTREGREVQGKGPFFLR